MVSAGYAIPDIAALKAIGESDRIDGYARLVVAKNSWYLFRATNSDMGDDDTVVVPNDSPAEGRFVKTSVSISNSSWKIVSQDYNAVSGDRLVVDNINGFFNAGINLPSAGNTGLFVELIILAANNINIQTGGVNYKGSAATRLEFSTPNTTFSLIYIDQNIGWIPTVDNLLTPINDSGGVAL